MRVAGIVAIVALVGIALASFRGFNDFIEDKADGLGLLEKYTVTKGVRQMSGIALADGFVTLMVYLFRDRVLINPTQWWIFAEWAAVFAALNWLNAEFLRKQMHFVWAFFFLWNIAGLAPFLALIMIYYVVATERQVSKDIPDRQISAFHALITLIRVALFMAIPIVLRLAPTESDICFFALVAYIVLPSILDIVWAIIPSGAALKMASSDGAISRFLMQLSYVVVGVVGFGLHVWESTQVIQHFGGFESILQGNGSAILAEIVTNGSTRLIMYDAPLSLASIIVFIFYDGGIFAGLRTVVLCALLGPAAALAFYFGNRKNKAAVRSKSE